MNLHIVSHLLSCSKVVLRNKEDYFDHMYTSGLIFIRMIPRYLLKMFLSVMHFMIKVKCAQGTIWAFGQLASFQEKPFTF